MTVPRTLKKWTWYTPR